MSLADFTSNPWKKSHPSYEHSLYSIRPAPEFSTAEVAVASLYRCCGYPSYSETEVPKSGRDLDRRSIPTRTTVDHGGRIRLDTWRAVLHSVLESPKQPNQSSKRFLSLCPVVPEAALYSGSARLAGNSWNPGLLIKRMVQLGSRSNLEAQALWDRTFEALSVGVSDDVWARWLQEEFLRHKRIAVDWREGLIEAAAEVPFADMTRLRIPAQQFVADLDAVLAAKASMTRRQWVSLLEAVVRLGMVSHVIWLCRLNDKLWRAALAILQGSVEGVPANEDAVRQHIVDAERRYLSYGNPATAIIKNYVSGYLMARIGLNLVLWMMHEKGMKPITLHSPADIWRFLTLVRDRREQLLGDGVLDALYRIQDEEARAIACRKGIGTNLIEFARHTLGQRLTSNDALRGYDQSYFLRKASDARNSQWMVSLGPVAVLAIAHCCLREVRGPRSIQRLSDHLANYGIEVDTADISSGDLGGKLRTLGLVLDSPDAETGMLLIPPFTKALAVGISQ